MCIIAIKPKSAKMFSDEEIRIMFANNSDGAGFAYNSNGNVIMKKGYFTADALLKELHSINFNHKDLLLHFRIGTSGKMDKDNCHPFKIKENLYFAHNGILSDYTDYKSDKSDTQHFNEKVLKNIDCYQLFRNNTARFLLEEMIGTNKLAFIDTRGVFMIGDFKKDNGRFYSNTSYKAVTYTYTSKSPTYSYYNKWYKDDDYYDYYAPKYNNYSKVSDKKELDLDHINDGIKDSVLDSLEYMYDSVEYEGGSVMKFHNPNEFTEFMNDYCELYATENGINLYETFTGEILKADYLNNEIYVY